MPCLDSYSRGPADFGVPQLKATIRKQKAKLDFITRLLCGLCKQVESSELASGIADVENGELKLWWEAHKKMDAAREAREAKKARVKAKKLEKDQKKKRLKTKALSKLSRREQKLLGLKN